MDESLSAAARTGNVGDLYRLIRLDGNALRRFDDVEFVDTPLHIAAEAGCIGFAMEIMVFMCITYKVSKLSISIVGCWIFYYIRYVIPMAILPSDGVLTVAQGLFDQFWAGTILAVGYGLLVGISSWSIAIC